MTVTEYPGTVFWALLSSGAGRLEVSSALNIVLLPVLLDFLLVVVVVDGRGIDMYSEVVSVVPVK
jgi:hypothetical protein